MNRKARAGPGTTGGRPEVSRFAAYADGMVVRGHTTDRMTRVLREAILDGALPPATRLREAELARELCVSRTPVREALRRLSVEGLVEITANRGALVATMTTEDVLEVYAVREDLEGLAAYLAARHRSGGHIEQLLLLLDRMRTATGERDYPELARLNLDFHKVIREAAGNVFLDRFLTQVEHAVRRFGRTTLAAPGRAEEALEEHREIAGAISSGDADTAKKLSTDHMRRARDLRIRALFE